MQLRHNGFLLLLLFIFGCATTNSSPLTETANVYGISYHVQECRELRLRVAVPTGWEAKWQPAPTAALRIAPVDSANRSSLLISVDPLALKPSEVLEKLEPELAEKGMKDGWRVLIGNVGSHQALGMESATPEARMTLFTVDHDRGIYLIVMTAYSEGDRRMLDEIFSRLLIED